MNVMRPLAPESLAPVKPAWGAVFSLALGVFGLVTAEFLPASLLTPIAASLGVSEGMAGQMVTVTAAVALLTGLVIAPATRRIDRRWVLIGFSVLLIASNVLVAFADHLLTVLAARILLGVAIGGFWTLSAATAMRLVPEPLVPRALSIIFSGVSLATIAAAPLGSYLGALLGWRHVFLLAVLLGVLALLWQLSTLPRMAASGATRFGTLLEVLRRPGMGRGVFACVLVFTGHFAFFTYLRPFLEVVTGVSAPSLAAILLGFGVANFLGTSLSGLCLQWHLRRTLYLMPLAMSLLAMGLVWGPHSTLAHAVLVMLWGMAFGAVPVAWTTWVTRTVPDEAESGGGLVVAAVQLAITVGAAMGGAIFDFAGARGVFGSCALLLLLAAVVIGLGVRVRVLAAST